MTIIGEEVGRKTRHQAQLWVNSLENKTILSIVTPLTNKVDQADQERDSKTPGRINECVRGWMGG